MPNKPITGNKIIMQLDLTTDGGTPDWALVGCLTDTDIDSTRETIDASSKCGPAQLAGQKTDTVNFTGFLDTDPEPDMVTLDDIAAIYDSADVRHWRLLDEDGGALFYREFNATLTAWNEDVSQNAPVTFTGAMGVTGDIIRTLPVS